MFKKKKKKKSGIHHHLGISSPCGRDGALVQHGIIQNSSLAANRPSLHDSKFLSSKMASQSFRPREKNDEYDWLVHLRCQRKVKSPRQKTHYQERFHSVLAWLFFNFFFFARANCGHFETHGCEGSCFWFVWVRSNQLAFRALCFIKLRL